ncbi:hypothetical protein Tco_0429608 [Tanacetum coccineum]
MDKTKGATHCEGKEIDDEDLSIPFKETLKTPFTRRIIEFSGPEYSMPTNIALYNGSTDPADHLNRFVGAANSGEWPMPIVRKAMIPSQAIQGRWSVGDRIHHLGVPWGYEDSQSVWTLLSPPN